MDTQYRSNSNLVKSPTECTNVKHVTMAAERVLEYLNTDNVRTYSKCGNYQKSIQTLCSSTCTAAPVCVYFATTTCKAAAIPS